MTKPEEEKLLLHACCGPCSTTVLEELAVKYSPLLFWYNPNIEPKKEHDRRFHELEKLAGLTGTNIFESNYDYERENQSWHEFIVGLEDEPEGGKRCQKCFLFRLKKATELAESEKLPFATTLTVSPYKDAIAINRIGEELSDQYLKTDFKKNNGYRRSVELSKEYGVYRQNYCGCLYSKRGS
jgi:predicted adenine nucleotide alpha hydrolase (AANH) superfamily ATPase